MRKINLIARTSIIAMLLLLMFNIYASAQPRYIIGRHELSLSDFNGSWNIKWFNDAFSDPDCTKNMLIDPGTGYFLKYGDFIKKYPKGNAADFETFSRQYPVSIPIDTEVKNRDSLNRQPENMLADSIFLKISAVYNAKGAVDLKINLSRDAVKVSIYKDLKMLMQVKAVNGTASTVINQLKTGDCITLRAYDIDGKFIASKDAVVYSSRTPFGSVKTGDFGSGMMGDSKTGAAVNFTNLYFSLKCNDNTFLADTKQFMENGFEEASSNIRHGGGDIYAPPIISISKGSSISFEINKELERCSLTITDKGSNEVVKHADLLDNRIPSDCGKGSYVYTFDLQWHNGYGICEVPVVIK